MSAHAFAFYIINVEFSFSVDLFQNSALTNHDILILSLKQLKAEFWFLTTKTTTIIFTCSKPQKRREKSNKIRQLRYKNMMSDQLFSPTSCRRAIVVRYVPTHGVKVMKNKNRKQCCKKQIETTWEKAKYITYRTENKVLKDSRSICAPALSEHQSRMRMRMRMRTRLCGWLELGGRLGGSCKFPPRS